MTGWTCLAMLGAMHPLKTNNLVTPTPSRIRSYLDRAYAVALGWIGTLYVGGLLGALMVLLIAHAHFLVTGLVAAGISIGLTLTAKGTTRLGADQWATSDDPDYDRRKYQKRAGLGVIKMMAPVVIPFFGAVLFAFLGSALDQYLVIVMLSISAGAILGIMYGITQLVLRHDHSHRSVPPKNAAFAPYIIPFRNSFESAERSLESPPPRLPLAT